MGWVLLLVLLLLLLCVTSARRNWVQCSAAHAYTVSPDSIFSSSNNRGRDSKSVLVHESKWKSLSALAKRSRRRNQPRVYGTVTLSFLRRSWSVGAAAPGPERGVIRGSCEPRT